MFVYDWRLQEKPQLLVQQPQMKCRPILIILLSTHSLQIVFEGCRALIRRQLVILEAFLLVYGQLNSEGVLPQLPIKQTQHCVWWRRQVHIQHIYNLCLHGGVFMILKNWLSIFTSTLVLPLDETWAKAFFLLIPVSLCASPGCILPDQRCSYTI